MIEKAPLTTSVGDVTKEIEIIRDKNGKIVALIDHTTGELQGEDIDE